MDAETSATLAETGWLAAQPEPFRLALLSRCLVKRFPRGATLYRRGDAPGGLYGLASGSLAYVFPQAENEAHLIHVGLPGAWIGEAAMLRNKPRAMTLKALTPSVVAHLPLRGFEDLVAAEPVATWRALALLAAEHQVIAASIVSDLLPQTPLVRLAGRLLGLVTQEPANRGQAVPVLPVTQTDLAAMVNLARPTVNKLLRQLADARLIAVGYGHVQVLDVDGLIRLVDAER